MTPDRPKVLQFPTDRAHKRGEYEPDPNGNCPKCWRKPSAMLNVHRDHYCVCDHCRTTWPIGSNIYSSWQYESEANWARNRALIASFRRVEPLCLPYSLRTARPSLPAKINTFEAARKYFDEHGGAPPDGDA